MATALKDQLDRTVVELLAERIARFDADFDRRKFTRAILSELESLELKQRINLIADTMAAELPAEYPAALSIVVRVAESDVGTWASWPLCSFVERHGVGDPVASLEAMPRLTKYWSCEFAIRPFLDQHLELAQSYLHRWVKDDHEAVRRLPSEGTRPLLPWGPKVNALSENPQIGIELLHALRHDPSETVRRSVANHLNDLAKSQPELVVEVLDSWTRDAGALDGRMLRHALRTLVKQGHAGALRLLGFTTDPQLRVGQFDCHPGSVSLGSSIELTAELVSDSDEEQLLVVDFVVHHIKASGASAPKVFKWKTIGLAPGESVRLSKRRRIEAISTRKYYPGVHRVDLQVAGSCVASTIFTLAES
jgi:3-methyladenine DNA glycosylase AlkC